MTNGKRNRQAGHKWERQLAESFRSIGFAHVVTTRSESRSRDNQKVDLINEDELKNGRFPFNVQAKTTTSHLSYAKLLSEMPEDRGVMNVILHKQTKKAPDGVKFMETGRFAIMQLDNFLDLVKQIYESKLAKGGVVRTTKGRVAKAVHDGTDTKASSSLPERPVGAGGPPNF